MKNYINWLINQFKSINETVKIMLAFFAGLQVMLFVLSPINMDNTIMFFTALLGATCTVYMMLGKPVNGVLGLISAFGLIYANLKAHHYASAIEQLTFIAFIDVPLILTWRTWGEKIESVVKHLNKMGLVLTGIAMFALYWLSVFGLGFVDGANPYIDSLSMVIGTAGSFFVWRGYAASFTFWLLLDIVNITLWTMALLNGGQAALFVLVIYAFYTATALYGRFVSVWSK